MLGPASVLGLRNTLLVQLIVPGLVQEMTCPIGNTLSNRYIWSKEYNFSATFNRVVNTKSSIIQMGRNALNIG